MHIPRAETAAVLIDVQERLYPHIHQHDRLLERLSILVQGLEHLEVPLLVTEQYSKGLGPTIAPLRELLGAAYRPIEKMTFSCCGEERFAERLSILGKRHVILMGVEAHVCVLQTALGLLSEGYIHGLNHTFEAVLQLRNQAGQRQVDGAQTALVTAGAGPFGGGMVLQGVA